MDVHLQQISPDLKSIMSVLGFTSYWHLGHLRMTFSKKLCMILTLSPPVKWDTVAGPETSTLFNQQNGMTTQTHCFCLFFLNLFL